MKSISSSIAVFFFLLIAVANMYSQKGETKTESFKVYGNCEMCKKTIEKAGNKKKISKVVWNTDTKIATITYNSLKTNPDEILKRIALVGYDNNKYLAPDDVYANLHGCCKYDRVMKSAVKTESKNQVEANTIIQSTNSLAKLFNSYFALKDALVNTNGNLASEKAKELIKYINEVKMEKLTPEEHTAWMKVSKDLTSDAAHIAETKETEHQRSHFMTLSKNMYEIIKVSKQDVIVYYQFCPMANDGKGANWLSKENTIKNPYYGSQMLSCGKTIETIK
jgi:copper chaperone CopZ